MRRPAGSDHPGDEEDTGAVKGAPGIGVSGGDADESDDGANGNDADERGVSADESGANADESGADADECDTACVVIRALDHALVVSAVRDGKANDGGANG